VTDLRCSSRKHAVLVQPSGSPRGVIEISCSSRWCGKVAGVVVLHAFDTQTGELIRTRLFKTMERK